MSHRIAHPAPAADERRLETYTLRGAAPFRRAGAGAALQPHRLLGRARRRRSARRRDPWLDCAIDWDATIAYRQRLWSLGLGVAEAMDTAQRGMGLDWPTSLELIRRSLDAARDVPGALVASRLRHRPPARPSRRRRSTTSSTPTKSRWRRSRRSAAG